MSFTSRFKKQLFSINDSNFNDRSLEVFDYQYHHNSIYHQFCDLLQKTPDTVNTIYEIPFLPIEFFRDHVILSVDTGVEKIFKSSGTTLYRRSTHYIPDLKFYHEIAKKTFEHVFGRLSDKKIIALLPSYVEQGDSSLISMVDHFLNDADPTSGYFTTKNIAKSLKSNAQNIIFGVSHALLNLEINESTPNTTIIETGGMKGYSKEITRTELHRIISQKTGIDTIWSEYGMTELQSQAYGKGGLFRFPRWVKTLIREVNDPFTYQERSQSGGINVIDLANVETCSFIETKDLGKINEDGSFEVLGRIDNSDIRGCNLMV